MKIREILATFLAAFTAFLMAGRASAATSISQFGITWTFDKDYPAGQFANGDWWVVGPVKIISFSPASTTSGTRTINGSMINPPAGKSQGYDTETYATYGKSYAGNVAVGVSASSPLTVNAGSSVVSSISHPNPGNRPQLTDAAVLTVLASPAPAGSFRPPYTGTDKTLRWNKNQLDYSRLHSLPKVANTPALATVEAYFERPWIEQNADWTGRFLHPVNNMPDYGRDMANRLAEGLLSLHLDYTSAQKEKLLIRLVQYGIDVYGAARLGAIWRDNGGHDHGRKMPMILAGLMLGDPGILAYADGTRLIFQEDRQTWYVRPYDVGRPLLQDDKYREEYIASDVGLPEWGEKHTDNEARDARNWGISYRDVVGHSILGHVLTARLMGAEAAWNWPALFDYADRYWNIEKNGGSLNNPIKPFVHAMWTAYRSGVPTNPPVNSAPSIVTQPASLSAAEGGTATFSVTANGTMPLAYQWQRNGAAIAGATESSYTTPPVTPADNGAAFRVVVTNNLGTVTSAAATLTVTAAAPAWKNFAFASQSGTFTAEFDAVPAQAGLDSVIGLSNEAADAYADLACAVRFNASNTLDARNGASYAAQTIVPYAPGSTYHLRMVVRVPSHTYDIFVRPPGGSELPLGQNFAFRVEQAAVASLNNRAEYHAVGSGVSVSNFTPSVVASPSIVSQPLNADVEIGQTATFSVTATGSQPLAYQWRRDGAAIAGATAASYTTPAVTAADHGAGFSVSVSNSAGSVTSGTATLNVLADDADAWVSQDIGSTGLAGSFQYNGSTGEFTVQGSGADIWGAADAFHFVRRAARLNGDGTIVARVASVTRTHDAAKAGVMIRETTAAGSKYAYVKVSPTNGLSFQLRTATGGNSEGVSVAGATAPQWVKLTRAGNQFSAYYSSDGTNWSQVGTTRAITMGAEVEVGLAVTSHNNAALCTAILGNVSVVDGGAPPQAPWTSSDIGSVGQTGSFSYNQPTAAFTVIGSGADIWGAADAFHFARRIVKLSGNGTIVARVQSLTNTHDAAKAGVMIRETTAANSKYAYAKVSPANGLSFQYRTSTGGNSSGASVSGVNAPQWLKLTRSGSQFSAYYSSDGATWTQVGSTISITMAADVEVGLAVTSHNNSALCTAVIGNVSVSSP